MLARIHLRVYTRIMAHSCFCILLRQASRKTSAIYDEALAPLGINVAQFSLLRRLDRAGTLSITELARTAELDRSTMGRNAKVLQRMGRELLTRGGPLWDKAQEEIEEKLGNNGVEQLQALLQAL
jgi:hypothetical protein